MSAAGNGRPCCIQRGDSFRKDKHQTLVALLSLTAPPPLRYYTTRELSNHAAEIWMLRALGDEIMDNGSGPNDHGYRNVGGGSGGA